MSHTGVDLLALIAAAAGRIAGSVATPSALIGYLIAGIAFRRLPMAISFAVGWALVTELVVALLRVDMGMGYYVGLPLLARIAGAIITSAMIFKIANWYRAHGSDENVETKAAGERESAKSESRMKRGFYRLGLFLLAIPKRIGLVLTLLAVFALITFGYWYVYGRQRELFDRFQGPQEQIVDAKLQLEPEDIGSALSGIIVSQKEHWIINTVTVHVHITETRHCGEKLQNVYSDIEWDKHCADDPNYSVEDVVEGKAYECFVGALAYLQQAKCNATTLLNFDPAKQRWDFSVFKVTGHPQDPLGVFR